MASRVLSLLRSSSKTHCQWLGLRSQQVRLTSGGEAAGGDAPGTTLPEICSIPLSQQVPWVPSPLYTNATEHTYDTHVTTLSNGLRVATESKFGQFCTIGVLIDSGSRYEVAYPSGITHFLEKLAFSATTKFESRDEIMQKLEKHGGICDCQGSRDTLIYAVSAESQGLQHMVDLLSEVVLRSKFPEDEIEGTKAAIQFELEMLNMRPDPEPYLVEMIHAAAYSNSTLGLAKICPEESLPLIDKGTLYSYMNSYHSPERMVLAGVGVDHDVLVKLAEEHFVQKSPIWTDDMSLIDSSKPFDASLSQYTGSLVQVEKDLSSVSLGPTPMPELAHCVIGLESCSHKDPDFIAFCVLNMMMGGGGSFSAGGPGKGMYTRLYLNVLNRHHWMYNATAYNHAYNDSGIFCIHASAHPSSLKDLVEVITTALVTTQHGIMDDELNRAKTQLQSMLLMNLESRPVVFEDIGRQVLAAGVRHTANHYYQQIAEITAEDVQRVARRMLATQTSVAALGDLKNLPSLEHIQSALSSKDGRIPKRFSLFR